MYLIKKNNPLQYLADKIMVMSKRPGKIKEIINVQMSRPRNRADVEYAKMSNDILTMLEEEVVNSKVTNP